LKAERDRLMKEQGQTTIQKPQFVSGGMEGF